MKRSYKAVLVYLTHGNIGGYEQALHGLHDLGICIVWIFHTRISDTSIALRNEAK